MTNFDYTKQLRDAYNAGATAGLLHGSNPKLFSAPSFENYLNGLREISPIVRG